MTDCIKKAAYGAVKRIYGFIIGAITKIFGIGCAKRFDAYVRFGRKLNFKNPETLADKVSYISIFDLPQLAVRCTDKWEVRQYVAEKGFEDILVPVYMLPVSRAEDIDFRELPESFVLKATHGCKMNCICTDKSAIDERKLKAKAAGWLKTTYGTYSAEPHYKCIPHRIYAEKLLAEPDKVVDYKFLCCNGKVTTVLVCAERKNGADDASVVKMKLYDTDWQKVDGLKGKGKHSEAEYEFEKPENLDEMIYIAERLSEDFSFVRVDMYNVDGKIYFGELTFTPANGVFAHYTDEFLEDAGKKLEIAGKEILV